MTDLPTDPTAEARAAVEAKIVKLLHRAARHSATIPLVVNDREDLARHAAAHVHHVMVAYFLGRLVTLDPIGAQDAWLTTNTLVEDPSEADEYLFQELAARGVDMKTIEPFKPTVREPRPS